MHKCLSCRSDDMEEIAGFRSLARVTSDARPFSPGGELFICLNCALVQKRVSKTWYQEISSIYANYYAYHQANGEEQVILDSRTGQVRRRSDVILDRVQTEISTKESGRWLDIGCGTGVTLKAVSKALPNWVLWGQEMDDRSLTRLRAIPRFQRLITQLPEQITGEYEFVSLIHVLEHFVDPRQLLSDIRPRLSGDGKLLIEVCDLMLNPFDLLIADHLTHFTEKSLTNLASRAGLVVRHITTEWVPKEISAILEFANRGCVDTDCDQENVDNMRAMVQRHVEWLAEVVDTAEAKLSCYSTKGLFGTSIAATWLTGALRDNSIDFYVDEDPSRHGRLYLGKPVLSPSEVPDGAGIFLGLAPHVAMQIANRLGRGRFELILPPDY